jgi:hypothetical protein
VILATDKQASVQNLCDAPGLVLVVVLFIVWFAKIRLPLCFVSSGILQSN